MDVTSTASNSTASQPPETSRRRVGVTVALLGVVCFEVLYGCVGETETKDFIDENVGEVSQAGTDQPSPCGGPAQSCCMNSCNAGLACSNINHTCIPISSSSLFYGAGDGNGDGSSDIYRFNYSNLGIVNFVKIGEAGRIIWDLAATSDNLLYGVDPSSNLVSIDTSTGAATVIGYTGYSLNALVSCGGLYGWGGTTLVKLNTSNGAATPVGNVGYTSAGDLACPLQAPWNLYGTAISSQNNDQLVSINPSYGAGTLVGSTGYSQMNALTFDQNNVLFGARASNTALMLYAINRATGAASLVALYPTYAGMYGLTTPVVFY